MIAQNPLAIFESLEQRLADAQTIGQVNQLFVDFAKPLGVDFFACACIQGSYSDPERSRMLGYNDTDWMRYYMDHEFWRDDPIFNYGKIARRSFTFTEALEKYALNDNSRRVMIEGERFGIKEGFAIPLEASDDHLALFSIAGRSFPKERGQLHLAAIWSLRALTLLEETMPLEKIKLTARELEALQLSSEGFTPDEIAEHMGVSLATVRQHLKSAKFKTKTRTPIQLGAILGRKQLVH